LAELMVVIAIMAILYIEMPDMIATVEGPKGNRALSDAQMIMTGLWGLNEDSNGFAGDIGFLNGIPGNFSGYNDLAFPPPGSQYAARWTFAGVSGGWNGPYVGFQPSALQMDPWFTPWSFTADGLIHSNGADTINNTADDITVPAHSVGPLALGKTGTLALTVLGPDGIQLQGPVSARFEISNPDPSRKGAYGPIQSPQAGGGSPSFVFTNLQPGQHGIQIYGNGWNGVGMGGNCDGTALTQPEVFNGVAMNSCASLIGHAVAFVWGGGYSSVTVRLH
jgi:hypothetical protein